MPAIEQPQRVRRPDRSESGVSKEEPEDHPNRIKCCTGYTYYDKILHDKGQEPICYGYLRCMDPGLRLPAVPTTGEFGQNAQEKQKVAVQTVILGSAVYTKRHLEQGNLPLVQRGFRLKTSVVVAEHDNDAAPSSERQLRQKIPLSERNSSENEEDAAPSRGRRGRDRTLPQERTTNENEPGGLPLSARGEEQKNSAKKLAPEPLIKIRDWEEGKKVLEDRLKVFPKAFQTHLNAHLTTMTKMPGRMAESAKKLASFATETVGPKLKQAFEDREDGEKPGDDEKKRPQ